MRNRFPIVLENYLGITVLRDDLLPGGTKSTLLHTLLDPSKKEYVYASPVQGGFQIALSKYCEDELTKKATIFCARRIITFPNTQICLDACANIVEVKCGYLSVVQAKAREYALAKPYRQLIEFGAKNPTTTAILTERVKTVIKKLGKEPKQIWCAVGSGLLVESILAGTRSCKVIGVVVGKDYQNNHRRLALINYPKPFDKESKITVPFPSMPHYDRKAFELCLFGRRGETLFWNVL